MTQVTYTASMRSNLTSLQQTADLMTQTQERLASGKKVNSALDNPTNFFAAAAHMQRANDLASRKDGMGESIQSIKAANTGIEGIKSLLSTSKGLVETARTTSQAGLSALYTQFNQVAKQINQLIADSGYKGTNFLKGTAVTLDVMFNETGTNKLTLTGFTGKMSAIMGSKSLGVKTYTAVGKNFTSISSVGLFSKVSILNLISNAITQAVGQLGVEAAKMAANLAIVNTRLEFTNSLILVEKTGADKLTLADQNEEAANMLMLQTRNQLGTTSLSMSSQAAQGVLRLF